MIETSGRLEIETYKNEYDEIEKRGIYSKDGIMMTTFALNIFLFIWFSQFILGCQNYIIASSVCQWYFTRNKSKLDSPMTTSFRHLTLYHLGSVLFGSLIITIVHIVKMFIESFREQVRQGGSAGAQILYCLCKCLVDVIYEGLKYITKNAYILIAMSGMTFISAGRRAFDIIRNNVLRIFVINTVGDFVLVLFKIFVLVATICLGAAVIMDKPGVSHHNFIIAFCSIIGFLACHCFLTVFEMAVDTIFICFCVDCEENDGELKPYYMSEGLKEVIQNLKDTLDLNDDANPLAHGFLPQAHH